MAAILNDLLHNRGKNVLLEFDDGDLVEAKLLNVDVSEHEDIVFDVVRIRRAHDASRYSTKNVYLAAIRSVVRVEPLD
jgi:hypothetical protein